MVSSFQALAVYAYRPISTKHQLEESRLLRLKQQPDRFDPITKSYRSHSLKSKEMDNTQEQTLFKHRILMSWVRWKNNLPVYLRLRRRRNSSTAGTDILIGIDQMLG